MPHNNKVTSPILAGLKGDERSRVLSSMMAARPFLDRLEYMIDKEIKDLDNSIPDFDKASWAYEQAFKIGMKKGLTLLKKYAIINS